MDPEDIIAVGALLIVIPFLIALLSSIWIVPLGVFVFGVGFLLYLFKKYHLRRMNAKAHTQN
jgi:Flp pilus assembly protein TadB